MQNTCTRIIVEGTDYSNTKEIALGLSEHSKIVGQIGYQRYTSIISAVWGNFNDFPWGKNLVDFGPDEGEQAMENYGTWVRLIELQGSYNWIVDRFHVSTQVYQLQNNNNLYDFKQLEARLLKLGFHLVHVVQSEEVLTTSIADQNKSSVDCEIERVLQAQEIFHKIVSKSILPTFGLDNSRMDIKETVENIIGWLEEVGSYTQPENGPTGKIIYPAIG